MNFIRQLLPAWSFQPDPFDIRDYLSDTDDLSDCSSGDRVQTSSDDSILAPIIIEAAHTLHSTARETNREVVSCECRCVIANPRVPAFDLKIQWKEGAQNEKQRSSEASCSEGGELQSVVSTDDEARSELSPRQAFSKVNDGNELYGIGHSLRNELDNLPNNTSDAQHTSSLSNDFVGFLEDDEARPVLPWKETISKLEIPLPSAAPPTSEITDLGDRGFHANLKHDDKFQEPFPLKSHPEHLALQDQLFKMLVKVYEEKKGFFPRRGLSSLVTEDCVFNELSQTLASSSPAIIRQCARQICKEEPMPQDPDDDRPPKMKSFKKIFAVLVLIGKSSDIIRFLKEDVNDLDLPLRKTSIQGNSNLFQLRLTRRPQQELSCLRNWSQFQRQSFEEYQWTTISPFFHKGFHRDVKHFRLPDAVMLPFTMDSRRGEESDSRIEYEGGFGRVFMVKIHPDHHNFDIGSDPNFAIKRLLSPSKDAFKKEVEMLKMFSNESHPHLISLLATYEYLKVYYLIFPWADGNLYEYWSRFEPMPTMDFATIEWVGKQCEGISSGLLKVHKYHTSESGFNDHSGKKHWGRHGDLKPDNILWFAGNDRGILKISDFGLSEFSTIHSKSYRPRSRIATSAAYRPPECDIEGGMIGQSYDIWTLGCLYLEMITWLLGGWDFVQEFQILRRAVDHEWYGIETESFFELIQTSDNNRPSAICARVKPAVTKFMLRLHEHPSCTEFIHQFINMIELDMLLVKPEDPKERGRITSKEVHKKMEQMLDECRQSTDYACKPAVWKRKDMNPRSSAWKRIDKNENVPGDRLHQNLLQIPAPLQRISRRRSFQVAGHCACERRGSQP